MDEAELIGAAKAGDRRAFDELVRRSFVDTFTLARRLTGNEEDARDVVQDAYLRAWRGIGKFRGEAAFSTWMYRITANAAATHVKRRRRQQADSFEDDFEPVDEHAEFQPAPMAESSEALERISSALDELPPKLRSVVVLKDVYDLSHEAIADELGITVAAAKVRLHRGRRKLRDVLYEEGARLMQCEEVTALLPGLVDGDHDADPDALLHIETCLRCQAELARYRRLLRTLATLRSRYAEPTPGLLGETMAMLTEAAEEGARRTLLSGRRLAYAGAIGGTAVAAGATAALLIARSRKRSLRLAG